MTSTCGKILTMTEPRKMKNNCSSLGRDRTIIKTGGRQSE
jgi:hypothetical protein